jgi:hypothetical protein
VFNEYFRQTIGFSPYVGISPQQRLDSRTTQQKYADRDVEMRRLPERNQASTVKLILHYQTALFLQLIFTSRISKCHLHFIRFPLSALIQNKFGYTTSNTGYFKKCCRWEQLID